MRSPLLSLSSACLLLSLGAGCASDKSHTTGVTPEIQAAAHRAHDEYVAAINSNDLERIMGVLTDDVVYLASGAPPFVGKDAVRPWVKGYLDAFKTHWEKPVQEFVLINEQFAYERYAYTSTDTPKNGDGTGGDVVRGTGWGIVVYRREADGTWRVARDAWGPDVAAK